MKALGILPGKGREVVFFNPFTGNRDSEDSGVKQSEKMVDLSSLRSPEHGSPVCLVSVSVSAETKSFSATLHDLADDVLDFRSINTAGVFEHSQALFSF
jgi:hypothetical protein